MFLFSLVSQAQSKTAFLTITLTDLQSVLLSPTSDKLPDTGAKNQEGLLQILRPTSSQVKQINSKTLEYEKLYNEFYSGEAAKSSSSGDANVYKLAANQSLSSKVLPNQNTSYLVIYQIDPL
jgi:hypothetical protein